MNDRINASGSNTLGPRALDHPCNVGVLCSRAFNSITKEKRDMSLRTASLFSAALTLGGCATVIKPTDLAQPASPTCIQVPVGVVAHEVKGLLNFKWTTQLAPGPYIAEREDAQGTFYRAPPGGVEVFADEYVDKQPAGMIPRFYDGGIWLPRDAAAPAKFYTYFSTADAVVKPAPPDASCDVAVLVPDPQAQGVSSVAFATGGAIGGATGAVVGRSMNHHSSLSYGQAAGAGLVGGAIGGLIVASLINMDIGKINLMPLSKDPAFQTMLDQFKGSVVQLKPAPAPVAP